MAPDWGIMVTLSDQKWGINVALDTSWLKRLEIDTKCFFSQLIH